MLAVAVAAAALAVWVTLRADFLAYPGWLAVQKADMILGPVSSACTGSAGVPPRGSGRC